jgi:2-phosphosulfolactate phosphatase
MPNSLSVHFLPRKPSPTESRYAAARSGVVLAEVESWFAWQDELHQATAVVIDLLRASTTICFALAAGAREIIPCLEVDEARRLAAGIAPWPLLGGERGGVQIEGFDLGNSPDEYRPEKVAGRTIVFTTTNGTKAMLACRGARRVLIGSFVNLSAVCAQLNPNQPTHLICAGTESRITREDVLCAGAIVDRLTTWELVIARDLNDEARIARDAWRETMRGLEIDDPGAIETLARTLRDTRGGRNLVALGLERDIDAAAQIDRFPIVPELDTKSWHISAAPTGGAAKDSAT